MSNEMISLHLHLVKTACHGYVQEQGHALNEIRALLAQHAEPVISPGDEEFSHLSTIELRGYHKGWAAASATQLAEIKRLKGLQPEAPPRPPEGEGLPRYGLRWNGPQQPLATPMDDGYWTPWHLAVQVTDQWPKLEKPAKVGPGRFSAGISARLVVEAAQRHHEYEVTPEKEELRIAQGATSLAQRWRQAVLPPSAAVLCLMAIAAKNACGEDATGIPLFVFVGAIKAALAERHSDHARALDAATSLDDGGPYVSDT